MLPNNYYISIDKGSNQISFDKIDYNLHSIPLNSIDALDILDNWFYRWINILRNIKRTSNNIQFDLNGNIDTKIIIMFALFANVNLNQILFSVSDDIVDGINEIADEFGLLFNSNNFSLEKIYYDDLDTILNMAFYIKLGFDNQLDFRFYKSDTPIYNFSSAAMDMIKKNTIFDERSFSQIFDNYVNCSININEAFSISFKKELLTSLNDLKVEFDVSEDNSIELFNLIYNEVICSNTFGKLSVADFLTNKFVFGSRVT